MSQFVELALAAAFVVKTPIIILRPSRRHKKDLYGARTSLPLPFIITSRRSAGLCPGPESCAFARPLRHPPPPRSHHHLPA